MTAGMHYAGILTGEGQTGLFLHRQRIGIRTQGYHSLAGLSALDGAHQTMTGLAELHFHTHGLQIGLQGFGGMDLLTGQFRAGMIVAAAFDDVIIVLLSQFANVGTHCSVSS